MIHLDYPILRAKSHGPPKEIAKVLNAKQFDRLRLPMNKIAKSQLWDLKFIGIEVNPSYVEIANRRLKSFRTFARLVVTPEKIDRLLQQREQSPTRVCPMKF